MKGKEGKNASNLGESKWWRKPDGSLCYGSKDDCLRWEIQPDTGEIKIIRNDEAKGCDIEVHKTFEKVWRDPKTKLKMVVE